LFIYVFFRDLELNNLTIENVEATYENFIEIEQ